jgi:AbrB family looped-hinge helix DNA binding protein
MCAKYAIVNRKGQITIPADLRHKLGIEEGTRVAFIEEDSRLLLQAITDDFVDGMMGILAGRNLPHRIEREEDRILE